MASRFWVGGTGTWDASDTTHWAASSGGAGGQSVPGSTDTVTFDGSSGGGTVTVNFGGLITIQSLTCGAFTGTLDFAANDNSVTLTAAGGFSGSGAGTRTINLGDGTWTLSAVNPTWTMATTTNLTFNANASSIVFSNVSSATTRSFIAGVGLTYNSVTVGSNALGQFNLTAGSATIGTVVLTAPVYVIFEAALTTTITNAFTWAGSPSAQFGLRSSAGSSIATISVSSGNPTMSWAGLHDLTFAGGATFTATSSFDQGHNSGITITPPSGGAHVIGG